MCCWLHPGWRSEHFRFGTNSKLYIRTSDRRARRNFLFGYSTLLHKGPFNCVIDAGPVQQYPSDKSVVKLVNRHPFPGPGLAIRIPGAINKNKIRLLKEIDAIYINFLKEKKLYQKIWQAFAVLLPIRSVGVMGDERTYDYCCVLRAVTSVDGMTADFFLFSKNEFTEISNRIINNVQGVNRVLYDFTSKPPGTIEWE